MAHFQHQTAIDAPADEVFAWHARPGAFTRLVPPWARVRVVESQGGLEDGRIVLVVGSGPLRRRWELRHQGYEAGRQFQDQQVSGPFAEWRHTHRFVPEGSERSLLVDRVDYRLPLGALGALGNSLLERQLARLFRFRHDQTRHDLARHRAVRGQPPLRVVISGASGLIGSALAAFLGAGGHRVDRLVRGEARPGTGDVRWDPGRGEIDVAALEGADAVVHLAGESIAAGRWSGEQKMRILASRTDSTALLSRALAGLARPPRVLVSASAVGYYGNRGAVPLSEDAPAGSGFLADVCRAWEAATADAARAGIRVVIGRIGMVLTARGGALARMLPPFRLGLGGVIGSGRQWVSWITLDDLVAAIHHLLFATALSGPVNLVTTAPLTNADFTRVLARVLRRPARIAMPEAMVRLALGDMGQALLLEGARVLPGRLIRSGFQLNWAELEAALRRELGRTVAAPE